MKEINQDELKVLRKRQYRFFLIILTMVFLVVLGYTIYWEVDYHSKYNFKKVTAKVIEHVVEGDNVYDKIFYTVNGNGYEKTVTDYTSKNDINDEIIVYYDNDKPNGIIYSLDNRRYLLPIVSVMIGAVTLTFVIMYKMSYPKSKDKKKVEETKPEIFDDI